jgi:hypothetical protein
MVAIQVPQLDPEIWPEAPPEHGPVAVPRSRPHLRALPDRDTRLRRRRLVALALAAGTLLAAVAVGRMLWSAAVGTSPTEAIEAAPISGDVYIVQPGDTLWTIAERIAPGEDPRPVVDALRERNGDAELVPGERLVVGDS